MELGRSFETLVSFRCAAKIYFKGGESQYPINHRCRFSLGTVHSEPYIQIEGQGFPCPKRVKANPDCIQCVAAQRIEEGRLSIVFKSSFQGWDTILLSEVTDVVALRKFNEFLERYISHPLLQGKHSIESSSLMGDLRGASENHVRDMTPSAHNSPKKLRLSLSKRLTSYGARMIEAATTPTSTFYKSSALTSPVTESFLPSSAPNGRQILTPSRRSLVMQQSPNQCKTDVFQSPKRTKQLSSKRLPLTDLADHRNSSASAPAHDIELKKEQEGFANLGNTCYMNAVLQSLLGLDPFAEDMMNSQLVKGAHPKSLYRMMFLLLKSKRAKDSYESQKILLKRIKAAISSRSSKFGGYRQQDAHELLNQCLDQLKEDVDHITTSSSRAQHTEKVLSLLPTDQTYQEVPSSLVSNVVGLITWQPRHYQGAECPCPVERNFQCSIIHTIACKSCGKATQKAEVIYDFALQLPKRVLLKPNQQANLQQQFDAYFASEDVQYSCSHCEGKVASLSHSLSQLPRILILYLKRYGFSSELSENSKRVDSIRIPRCISVDHLCSAEVSSPNEFTGPWPRDPSVFSSVVSDGENKENAPSMPRSVCFAGTTLPSTLYSTAVEKPATIVIQNQLAPHCARDVHNSALMEESINQQPCMTTHSDDKVYKHTRKSDIAAVTSDSQVTAEGIHSGNSILGKRNLSQRDEVCVQPFRGTEDAHACVCMRSKDEELYLSSEGDQQDMQQALEQSLMAEPTELQLLQQIGLSEEEQLKLALELSMQESHSNEASEDGDTCTASSATPETNCNYNSSLILSDTHSKETYRLMSIVSHIGRGSSGGHYISDVYSVKDSMWKSFNDSHVIELKEEDVRQRRQTPGYIFFYMHKSTYDSVVKNLRPNV